MTDTQPLNKTIRIITLPRIPIDKPTDVSPSSISPSSPDEMVVSPNQADVEPDKDDVLTELKGNMFMNPETSLHDLIRNSEYLQKYPSWLGFCGTENKKKYAPTFIARNDTIWELIFSERGYMDMLLMVRDVYMVPFPDFDPSQFDTGPDGGITNAQLREALFPGLDQLIRAHERLLRPLLALHDKAEDHVVKSLGSCLVKLFDRDTQLALSKLYGGFMFAQKRIRERLQICKRWPPVAQFFEKCKQDPRSARRSLEDCHMVIVQRWTKVETLLDAIIKNTLNHPVEVENLETARSTVRSLLKGAEAVMTAREHVDKLSDFADNLLVPVSSTEDTEEHRLRREMKSPNTSLINYGPLRIVPYAIGQQAPAAVEVIGVALNSCFFVLQRHPESGNYQLFKGTKMPPILWWGQAYGYFRKSVEKGSFGFFILLHSESVLTLFRCNTADELSRWERIMNHGFAQWRETAPVTMESLDLDLSQTLSAAAERWERTTAVLNLLYDLDADLERAWAARSCVCLASIEDRLNQVKTRQNAAEDNSVESDYFSTTPPGPTGNFGSRPKSAGYISRTPKAVSTPTTTADLLSKYTFLTELDSKSDLDQVFALFQENLDRLRFTIMGAPPSGLSRSASDVEERKRPPNKAIRKIETFSVRDSTHLPNDPKALAELNRKVSSKKREGHRLGSTVANIFRSGNRDKPASSLMQQISTDSTGTSTTKAVVMRPPTSNLNSTGSTNVQRHSSSSRPSLTVLMGSGGTDTFSIDGSGNGSCISLASQPSMDALSLLRDLNVIAEEFFSMVFRLRTRNDELEARVSYLETEKDKLQEVHTLAKQHGLFRSTCSHCGGDGGVPDGLDASPGSDAGLFALTVKQGTEKLRQDVENFQRKSEEWEKEYKRQRDSLEREHTKLAKEWARYEDARAELERRQRQYEENCKTLQQQVDLHASRGVKFTGITMPEIQLPDVTTGSASGNSRRGSSNSMRELAFSDLYASSNNKPGSMPVHSHSASDDLNDRWAQPSRFAKELHTTDSPSQLFVKDNETTPRNSLISTPSVRSDELPMHLRGSLLNQTSKKPSSASFGGSQSSLNQPVSVSGDNAAASSTNSALWKLADSSKPQSASKHKKASLFRRS